jgi:Tfp pilus assembly protein FimV
MSDFIETAKQKIGQGISRVSWEADKLRRTNAKQGEINTLKQEREQVVADLSNTVLTMYRQGRLTDSQLQQFCERILNIERDMTTRSAELEQIRAESYPGVQDARTGGADSGAASTGGAAHRPSAAGAPGSGRESASIPCPTCGEPVRSRALYCNKCGAKLR